MWKRSSLFAYFNLFFVLFLGAFLPYVYSIPSEYEYFKLAIPPFSIFLLLLVLLFFYKSFSHIYETNFEVSTLKSFFPGGIKYLEDTPVLTIPLFFYFTFLTYTLLYMYLGNEISESFFEKSKVSFDEAAYFSLTTLTVGPDGLTPNSSLVRKIVMSEIIVGLIYVILIFSSIGSLLQQKRNER